MEAHVSRDGAILNPAAAATKFTIDRFTPSERVARFVDHYWLVGWNLAPGAEHRQRVLSHPVVNLTIGSAGLRVTGPSRNVVERLLVGSGWAIGAMFRPGGFWPLLRKPVASIANTEAALADILPDFAESFGSVARAEGDDGVLTFDSVLAANLPETHQPNEVTTTVAELARSDRNILRAEQLAERFGFSQRTLQRRFSEHVGLTPKSVIRRYRLQEVAERALTADVDWAAVAVDLGFADQAHLIRDFRAVTGETPARYTKDQVRNIATPQRVIRESGLPRLHGPLIR